MCCIFKLIICLLNDHCVCNFEKNKLQLVVICVFDSCLFYILDKKIATYSGAKEKKSDQQGSPKVYIDRSGRPGRHSYIVLNISILCINQYAINDLECTVTHDPIIVKL